MKLTKHLAILLLTSAGCVWNTQNSGLQETAQAGADANTAVVEFYVAEHRWPQSRAELSTFASAKSLRFNDTNYTELAFSPQTNGGCTVILGIAPKGGCRNWGGTNSISKPDIKE